MTMQRSNDSKHRQGFETTTNFSPDIAEVIILELELRSSKNRAQQPEWQQSRQKGLLIVLSLNTGRAKRGHDESCKDKAPLF